MTAKEALAEVRRRLEGRRDDYRQAAALSEGSALSPNFNERRENHVWASCMSEALVVVGEVEKKLPVKGKRRG